jgi:hypothetical protein
MKTLLITLTGSIALLLIPVLANAQTYQATSPPLAQPLVREGDFAVQLAGSLQLGSVADETEAESTLSAAGVAPRNGWIADYPVTPDILGELQTSVSEAADAGSLTMGKDAALKALQDVVTQYNLNVQTDTSGREAGDTSGAEYPDAAVMDNYYTDEGPPVVTYYAPPPDYAYLYTWVPYPFWWWNSWFPGFFVLADFDVRVHDHGHGYDHGHDHDRGGHGNSVSNHFRDPRTGRMGRIDPTNRFRGGTSAGVGGSRWSSPAAQSGARGIVNTRPAASGQAPAGTAGRDYRGYGSSTRSSVGTRSGAFDRSGNSGVERSSSGRGFQSRSNAGQVGGRGSLGGGGVRSGGAAGSQRGSGVRSGGAGSFHGGGGGSHGGGRR